MTPPPGGSEEKTEQATPKKRKDAREKGQVLKSQEVNTALSLIIMFACLRLTWSYIVGNSQSMMTNLLSSQYLGNPDFSISLVRKALFDAILQMFTILAPILAFAIVSGLVVNFIQVGFLFTTKTLAPKFSRINPLEGFKRIFSLRSIMELFKSLLKIAIVVYIAYGEIAGRFDSFKNLMALSPVEGFATILGMAFTIGMKISMALLFVAAVDFGYQWWRHEQDLKMTKQEVKDEYKQTEGNPEIKGRIKQKQREMASMRMMQDVPEADVIITNPTQYAIALKYDENEADAPIVLAKGKDLVAQKIKEIGAEHGVERVENKPVAQALYVYCEVGDKIPEDMFQAVAEILAYVYGKREELKRGVG